MGGKFKWTIVGLFAVFLGGLFVVAVWRYQPASRVPATVAQNTPAPPHDSNVQPSPQDSITASILPATQPATRPKSTRKSLAANPSELHAAASLIKLWEPQLPSDIARGFTECDPEVVQWLERWQLRIAGGSNDPATDISKLESSLQLSRLTPDQLMQFIKALAGWEDSPTQNRDSSYGLVTGAFACQVMYAAKDQIAQDVNQRQEVMKFIAPLIRRLWYGQKRDAQAVEVYYTLLATYEPKGSSEWQRGHVGRSEAIADQGRTDDALAVLDQLERDLPNMEEGLRTKIADDRGLFLFRANRFAEAVAPLRASVKSRQPITNRADSRAFLVMALANSGNAIEAKSEYEQFSVSGDESKFSRQAFYVMRAALRSSEKQGAPK